MQVLFLRLVTAWCRVVMALPEASASGVLWQAASAHPGIVLQAYMQVTLCSSAVCSWATDANFVQLVAFLRWYCLTLCVHV